MNNSKIIYSILVGLILSTALFTSAIASNRIDILGEIKVIYPKEGQLIGSVDSTFIFGHVTSTLNNKLLINGKVVEVHKDGGFLAFLPIEPGEFKFELKLYGGFDEPYSFTDSLTINVNVPEPLKEIPADSFLIVKEYRPPIGDLMLTAGEKLEFSFQGTPGHKAYAVIEGLSDSIPMTESQPKLQPFWGENVFGRGAVPDSMKIAGIYTGQLTIPAGIKIVNQNIVYHLVNSLNIGNIAYRTLTEPNLCNYFAILNYLSMPKEVTLRTNWQLSTNSDKFPFVVSFADSMQIIRHRPGRGYYSIFQPAGVQALAVGEIGGWCRLKLSETQYAYCEKKKVEKYPVGSLAPNSLVRSIRTHSFADSVVIEIPLSGKHLFQISEHDRYSLSLRLFGVTTDTDWIRYDAADSLIDFILWSQPEPDLYELTVKLTDPLWGYETHYEGNTLKLSINQAPKETWRLKGKRIVIDPGHSSDAGAVGPTGLTEAEANLGIALVLEEMLKHAEVDVIMTRNDMSHVDLYGRPAIAKTVDADLFISIHNNALPDGVNPFKNNGVSAYYYHLHSLDLARAIQKQMVKATGAIDHGLYHGNLAVNRPTQYPAVLVECAFMMIPEQEAALKTYKYRKKVAKAIMLGIEDFLEAYDEEVNND